MGEDTVTYLLETNREDWRAWTDTLPRSLHIDDRLAMLIKQDTTTDRDTDELDKDASVLALRIRHKTRAALSSMGEEPDLETARENIKEIQEIADVLQS
jgi:hypothetical protein